MSIKKYVAMTVIAGAFVYGCSSSTTTTTPTPASDAGTPGKDTGTPILPPDDGGGDGTICKPGDVSTFTAPAVSAPKQGNLSADGGPAACTVALANEIVGSCFQNDTASDAKCTAALGLPDGGQCKGDANDPAGCKCLICVNPTTKKPHGPIVQTGNTISANIAGCLYAAGDKDCAAKTEAESACTRAACQSNCPVGTGDNDAALDALNACIQTASENGCVKFADEATTCQEAAKTAGGARASCLAGPGFWDVVKSAAVVLCAK